jgi:dipeptidase E
MPVPNLRLILAGGGDAADAAPLDRLFARWVGAGTVLYVPVAMDGTRPTYAACDAWVRSVFAPLGVRDVTTCTDLAALDDAALDRAAGVYIGGGNTFRLLDLVRRSGFGRRLIRYAARGGPVYGGSAGAILLGRDTATSAHADANDVGLIDTRGLDLAGGCSAWCHYVPDVDDERIAAYLRAHDEPVLAIPEQVGVVIEDGRSSAIGTAAVLRWRRGSRCGEVVR